MEGTGASVATGSTANWFSARYVINATVPVPTPTPTPERTAAACRVPDYFTFEYENKEYRVNVPEGEFETVAKAVQAEDFSALVGIALEV